ncbi:cell surface protein, partial [Clostridium sporogenes]
VTFNPWLSPYNIGTIAAGATVTILIRGTVDPSCTGTITNTARVDSTTPDPDPTNNETTIETPIETSSDLSIVKTVNPDPVVAGEEATYTITVSSAGPSDALDVILTDAIPACILNPEFSIDGGATFNPW